MKKYLPGLYCIETNWGLALIWYKGERPNWFAPDAVVLVGKKMNKTTYIGYTKLYKSKIKPFVATLTEKKRYQAIRRIFEVEL